MLSSKQQQPEDLDCGLLPAALLGGERHEDGQCDQDEVQDGETRQRFD
jgi:hypothetical protein